MAKSSLNWYKSRAKRIIKDLRLVGQKNIAAEVNVCQATVSRALNYYWQPELEKWLRLMDLAGYEVVEKEEVEE